MTAFLAFTMWYFEILIFKLLHNPLTIRSIPRHDTHFLVNMLRSAANRFN